MCNIVLAAYSVHFVSTQHYLMVSVHHLVGTTRRYTNYIINNRRVISCVYSLNTGLLDFV